MMKPISQQHNGANSLRDSIKSNEDTMHKVASRLGDLLKLGKDLEALKASCDLHSQTNKALSDSVSKLSSSTDQLKTSYVDQIASINKRLTEVENTLKKTVTEQQTALEQVRAQDQKVIKVAHNWQVSALVVAGIISIGLVLYAWLLQTKFSEMQNQIQKLSQPASIMPGDPPALTPNQQEGKQPGNSKKKGSK